MTAPWSLRVCFLGNKRKRPFLGKADGELVALIQINLLNQLNDARETATPLAIEHEAIETANLFASPTEFSTKKQGSSAWKPSVKLLLSSPPRLGEHRGSWVAHASR